MRKQNVAGPTLAKLNAQDNPADYGMECLGDDGTNQLWLDRASDLVANRFCDDDDPTVIVWDDDVAGWNYSDDQALA